MSVANERTVVLLAATFGVEPHELVDGTDYPSAKVERLPLVAARHTEVDLQLALLAADLRWVDALGGHRSEPASLAATTLRAWDERLDELQRSVVDPGEVARVRQAHQQLRRRAGA